MCSVQPLAMVTPQRPARCVSHAEIAVDAAGWLGAAVADFIGELASAMIAREREI